MKFFIILTITIPLVLAELYPSTYDYIDAYSMYGNSEVIQSALCCYLDIYPCDPVNRFLKQYTQDSFNNAGAYLTDRQKISFLMFYDMGNKYYPYLVKAFNAKYDPTGNLTSALEANLRNFKQKH